MQLRMVMPELGPPTISTLLSVPQMGRALNLQGGGAAPWLSAVSDGFLDDLLWWAETAQAQRARVDTPY